MRYPVTTRPGMSLVEQMEEDESWAGELFTFFEDEGKLTARKLSELLEILCKLSAHSAIRKQLRRET